MSSIDRNTREEVVFIGRNYKRKQTKYEDETCCSRKKMLCCCCLVCLVAVIAVIGICLVFILSRNQLSEDSRKWTLILEEEQTESRDFSLNDTFILVSYDETYSDYLSAIGVPWFVRPLVLSGSESVTMGLTERGAEVITSTDLVQMKFDQEMKFDWNTNFSMEYGTSPFSGVMYVICQKPEYHSILCSMEDKVKGWNMTSRWTFSEIGMVNERFVITHDIGTKKYYRRKDFQVTEEVNDNVETTDVVSDGWNDDDDDW